MEPGIDGGPSKTGSTDGDHVLAYLANFIENSLDAIVAYDSQGWIVFWNQSAERTFGWTAREALGKRSTDLFWPVYTVQEQDDHRQRKLKLDSGEIVQGEHIMQRKDGSLFWVKHSTHAILQEGSWISGYVAIYRDITKRKQAEEQLEQSNRRLNVILESIQDDFYVLDREWKFIFTSRSFTSKVGKEPEDFIGNNIWEMFPKHVGGVLYENFHIAMEKREIRQFEIPGKYTDAWYRMTAFPSKEGITVLGTDITEQRRMAREIESMARLPQENPNPVLRIHRDGVISFANAASGSLLRLWNCTVGEQLPESVHTLILQALESCMPIEREVSCEERVYSLMFTPVDDHDYVNIYGRDITERKRTEEALRESEERYRHLVKYAPAGIYEIDIKTNRFIEVNDIMCEILGYTREELLGMLPEELLDAEGRGRFRQRMIQTLAGKKVSEQTEYKVKARDGREIWAILNTTVNFEGGEARSVSVIAHDFTERKHTEEMLRESKERYATLFNSISEGFAHYKAIYNGAGKLVDILVEDINPAGAGMSGIDREAQVGKTWKQTWPEVPEALLAIYEQVDRTGESLRFDHHSPITNRIYQSSVSRIKPGQLVATFFDITEIIQAEKNLARQSELLQRVFDHIPVLLVMWDPALQRFTLNHYAETVLGWTTADANQGDFMSMTYPDPAYRAEVSAYMRSLEGGFRELVNIGKNGERIPIDWANIRLADETMVGIGVDLRERKLAKESLRAKTEEIGTLLQVSPIAFFVTYDAKCTRITANPAGYRLVELPQDPNLNISKSAPVEEQPTYRVFRDGVELASQDLPMQMAARQGIDVVEESLELRFEDGSSKYIYAYARPLMGENNKPRGAVAATLDITERKQVEEKIRASEERFRTLANTVPSIVWIADQDGTTTYTNEYWHKYSGSSSEETGSNWTDFLHPDDFERCTSAWTEAIRTGTDYFVETRMRRHDGQYRWFQARALPVRDSRGNIVAWYGVSTDIHDRVEAIHAMRESQQQLQFLNESLEQKVDEQTAELRRLTANLTKAEQRERSRIAHILHDDLQQRLYAVKMRLSLLMGGSTGDASMENEVAELDKQLAEILLLTRHLTIEMSPPVLRDEGLRQAIEWLAFQMNENLGLRIDVQAEESFAMADEAVQVLLFSCVRELLFNIVKHAGVNQATVSLQQAGDRLRIVVWDDGKGFDVAALFRNNKHNTDDTEDGKATFGLPTLRHQLHLLGGQMEIQSEPGAGTRITITIPYS